MGLWQLALRMSQAIESCALGAGFNPTRYMNLHLSQRFSLQMNSVYLFYASTRKLVKNYSIRVHQQQRIPNILNKNYRSSFLRMDFVSL